MAVLTLRLAGPLQSWGSSSRYSYRDTEDFPTKSGVVGLLAAALGRKREEPLEDLNELRMGIRIDHKGSRMMDYQVSQVLASHNKSRKDRNEVAHKYYLEDAAFLVALEHEDKEFLQELEYALSHPVFTLYLGRKSCPPTMPLCLGVSDDTLLETLQKVTIPESKSINPEIGEGQIYMEGSDGREVRRIKGKPISFNHRNRKFASHDISLYSTLDPFWFKEEEKS